MNKPVQYVMTRTISDEYNTSFIIGIISLAKALWTKQPIDLLVFDNGDPGLITVTADGYDIETGEYINRHVYTWHFPSRIKKFWIKYDEYETHWIGTILFPEDY